MTLAELLCSPSQKIVFAEAIKAVQMLIDGRYLDASEIAYDTGLSMEQAEQIVRSLRVLREIDVKSIQQFHC